MAEQPDKLYSQEGYVWLAILVMSQLFFLALLVVSNNLITKSGVFPTFDTSVLSIIIPVFLIGIYALSLFVLQFIQQEARVNSELKTQIFYFRNIEELVASVRAQRHDFVNHIQALYGLMKIGSYHNAMDYMQQIYAEVRQESDLLRMQPREVGALLHAKVGLAAARGVEVRVKMDSSMTGAIPMLAKDLNRILGNLIDNAVDALEDRSAGDRWVQVRMEMEKSNFILQVSNGGPPIPTHLQGRIFQLGYTTKGQEKHSGMGLYAVQQLTRRYRGRVELVSNEESGTCFTVTVPVGREEKEK